MVDNLKNRTAFALVWNSVDKFGFQFIALVVGIITARMLSPRDFGLMGALSLFVMLSNILVESGFTSALIRRDNNTDDDYSAIFIFNVAIALVIYLILFFSAPLIASFFRMPELCNLSRFLFLSIIINSFGIVQNIILSKTLSFKTISLADLTSAVISGIITVLLVVLDFGYWSLACQLVIQNLVRVAFLWVASSWKLRLQPNFTVIKEVFAFSSFLLFSSFMNTIFRNIYSVIIGRLFNPISLGYYYQANKYQQIPSTVIQTSISGVAYPVLSELKMDEERQLIYLRKIVRITACIIFPIMFGLSALIEPLVSILLTDKWLPAVPYFQMLVPVAILLPFHSLNLNIILIRGHVKMNFLLESVKNGLILLSIFIVWSASSTCIGKLPLFDLSIDAFLVSFCIANILSYIFDIITSQRFACYFVLDQLRDIFPYVLVSFVMYFCVVSISILNNRFSIVDSLIVTVTIQVIVGLVSYVSILKILGSKVMDDVWTVFVKHRLFN